MAKSRRIEAQWEHFKAVIGLAKTSPVQQTEMRRAFYAGVEALMRELLGAMTPGDDVADADVKVLEEINAELCEFRDKLLRGEA